MKYVILHNIRSRYNVGATFRTSDGAGVARLFLTGYTPTPIDRFGRPVAEIIKTSLNASTMVPWEHAENILAVIQRLKADGVTLVAIEQTPTAISLYDFVEPAKVAYIFGNEITGIENAVVAACDAVVEIPMRGQKESLNVSVTAGVVLFHTNTV